MHSCHAVFKAGWHVIFMQTPISDHNYLLNKLLDCLYGRLLHTDTNMEYPCDLIS